MDITLDSILSSAGLDHIVQQPTQTTQQTSSEQRTVVSLSDSDLDEILSSADVGMETTAASTEEEPEHSEPQEEQQSQEEAADTTETVQEPTQDPDRYIPHNSKTLLIDDSTTRFSGTEWYNEIQNKRIILAGIGGIGSNTAFQLARMHPAGLWLYDDDRVQIVNFAGQLFSTDDLGKYKVDAMANRIQNYTTMTNVYAIAEKFTSNSHACPIMICGFDNMEARKTFYKKWKEYVDTSDEDAKAKCLFIDGRLSIDTLQVLTLTGTDYYNQKRYEEEFLFDSSEAEATICSLKQTTYMACMIGSFIVNLFTNFVANSLNPVVPYDLPFFLEYNAQSMLFKFER